MAGCAAGRMGRGRRTVLRRAAAVRRLSRVAGAARMFRGEAVSRADRGCADARRADRDAAPACGGAGARRKLFPRGHRRRTRRSGPGGTAPGVRVTTPKPTFFETPAAFRRWLKANHKTAAELWVGYYKKATGRGGMTYAEAVEEALCFGSIDGVVKSFDAGSYGNRFTPRKKGSNWSAVN